ncbi:UpxY family transcription antiterminator [Cytophaga sp. FL35]|uniref:UpxY family transcription antiterminator n=1 Tax=Cytophaga sp. FL35 TaxID=1904456 RepID=UPI0016534EB7|nr:UpxY family transcription antiterminator [Cytophaga sp. FL35]MBC6999399.1 UpxY family transcription antiterminator [Cytophaga sp. FL35]
MISPKWFVLLVKPQNEIKVASALNARGYEVFCPTITEIRQWSDRKKKIKVPLFKSYVFIKIPDAQRGDVFGVTGIVRYLFWLGRPAVVRDEEIDLIRNWLNNEDVDSISLEQLTAGKKVAIKHGVLREKRAIVEKVGRSKIVLILEDLGVKVCVQLRDVL